MSQNHPMPSPAAPLAANRFSADAASHGRFVDHYLSFLLAQASYRISEEFHAQVRTTGLTVTEWRVLSSLLGSDGETIGRLAYLTLTKQPTLSKLVHRLERDGLVQRTREEDDRRQTRVQLTEHGEKLAQQLCDQALRHQESVLAPLTREQATALLDTLQVLMGTPEIPTDAGWDDELAED
ncbi:MAG: MarR family winged helix-turn-helix transcriptional regulator [Pigmentiphaga sp.]